MKEVREFIYTIKVIVELDTKEDFECTQEDIDNSFKEFKINIDDALDGSFDDDLDQGYFCVSGYKITSENK
jgi:hypothetical protein